MNKMKCILILVYLTYFLFGVLSMDGVAKTKGSGHNRLNNIFFLSRSSQLLGDCNSDPGSLRFWSLENGKLNKVVSLDENEFFSSIAVSNDESLIAAGIFKIKPFETRYTSTERSIGCYSIKENKWIWKVKWGGSPGDCNGCDIKVAFTSDNSKIIAVGVRYVVTYDVKTGNLIEKNAEPFKDHSFLVHSKKKGKVFSQSMNYFIAWQEKPIEGHEILSGLFTSDKLTIWDLRNNMRIASWKKEKPICSATFTPDEKIIIFGTMDGYVNLWDFKTKKIIKEWRAHWVNRDVTNPKDITTIISISSDGNYVATFGDGEKLFNVKIWDIKTGSIIHEFHDVAFWTIYCENYPMVFSNDMKYFAFQKWGNLCLYDVKTWEEKWCVPSWSEDDGKKWRYNSRPGTFEMIR